MSTNEIVMILCVSVATIGVLAYMIDAMRRVSNDVQKRDKIYIYGIMCVIVVATIILIGGITQNDELIEFDTYVENIVADTDYPIGHVEFSDINNRCNKVDEVFIWGIAVETKEDCVKYVVERT
ncbi:MAG: hypothetical protein KAJ03_10555 [Gammaproteobacteria bacterium]|nr:hypothetical protein [Gammaproteobacteria bacterium]